MKHQGSAFGQISGLPQLREGQWSTVGWHSFPWCVVSLRLPTSKLPAVHTLYRVRGSAVCLAIYSSPINLGDTQRLINLILLANEH